MKTDRRKFVFTAAGGGIAALAFPTLLPAARHGFWGVTPWNYSLPSYWRNWPDVKQYRTVNQRFLRS